MVMGLGGIGCPAEKLSERLRGCAQAIEENKQSASGNLQQLQEKLQPDYRPRRPITPYILRFSPKED
jgi:hypothetical protein